MIVNSSVDQSELEKFDKISESWWDKNGEFKILHQINPIRLQFIKDKISLHWEIQGQQFMDLSILDVGCGGGLVTVPMHQLGANVTGLDASNNNIKVARNYAEKHNLSINYLHCTVEELATTNLQYDVLLCLELVEHVANINYFIKSLASLLKPNGMLILSTLNRTIKSYLLGIIVAEYLLGWVPKRTHDYSKFLKPSELYHLLYNHQMCLKELKGLTFNPSSGLWSLSDDINVNYFAYVIKNNH